MWRRRASVAALAWAWLARGLPSRMSLTRDISGSCRTEFTTAEAIDAEVQKVKAAMFTLRIQYAKREAYQPAQYSALKKRVAQLMSIKREREIVAGVDRRDSKAAEKRRMVEAGLSQF